MNPDYTQTLPKKYLALLSAFSREPMTIPGHRTDLLVYRYDPPKKTAKTLLVTAGFDGDECDGIYAGLSLPRLIEKLKPDFSIIVLPIVNPWGFEQGVSYIPADRSFPKYYFPGSPTGNRAEQLVWHLKKNYFTQVSGWLDLHGGNQFETLMPYVTAYVSDTMVDGLATALLSGIQNDESILQTYHRWPKIAALADEGIAYVLSEAGELGTSQEKAVAVHLQRFRDIVPAFAKKPQENISTLPLSVLDRYDMPLIGRWRPQSTAGSFIQKGETLGHYYPLGLPISIPLTVKNTGRVLWIPKASGMKVLEPVAHICYRI